MKLNEFIQKLYVDLETRCFKNITENDIIYNVNKSLVQFFRDLRESLKQLEIEAGYNISYDSRVYTPKSVSAKRLTDDCINFLEEYLRPYLTNYASHFSKWYEDELKKSDNLGKDPNEIEKNYPKYNEMKNFLIEKVSKEVNIFRKKIKELR